MTATTAGLPTRMEQSTRPARATPFRQRLSIPSKSWCPFPSAGGETIAEQSNDGKRHIRTRAHKPQNEPPAGSCPRDCCARKKKRAVIARSGATKHFRSRKSRSRRTEHCAQPAIHNRFLLAKLLHPIPPGPSDVRLKRLEMSRAHAVQIFLAGVTFVNGRNVIF